MYKLPLKDCKLWWPAWQQGIPFNTYGYGNEISGHGYVFKVDKELDAWLCPDGQLMPIYSATLYLDDKPFNEAVLHSDEYTWISFSILSGGRVQVNGITENDHSSRTVDIVHLEDLYFVGDTYFED